MSRWVSTVSVRVWSEGQGEYLERRLATLHVGREAKAVILGHPEGGPNADRILVRWGSGLS